MGSLASEDNSSFPKKPVPSGAWDTHHHIFEPDRFPFAEGRHFTPARASLEDLQKFAESIGVDHVCIAHGLSYGFDCKSLLYYLEEFHDQARGICVLDLETVSDELLDEYHVAGIRSVRPDFFRHKAMNNVQQPHLTFWSRLRDVVDGCPVPVVVDHFALIAGSSYRVNDYATNIQDGSYLTEGERIGLAALCETLRNGNLWIKISAPYRCSNLVPGYDDLRWLVRRFVDANPRRVEAFLQVDDKPWIESLSRWMSEGEWQLWWVENPATLYDYQE
ncbi:hypothetical protein BDV38DRAFT_271267 [Aspergillus pseudotamarii]|uniref:Amidohydrolase-related domain-containing protein n=1 Tax=Aspergillus pseudotamarii TaxID=132259 RepID=A0A5N6SS07_ASPPS|nr:uncharacterized protein BDV38DRAFT_271267 [Aspergillus pseudotamarii]KAE8137405.1 hypothetical protein BDV38DRAFT_271267 [Aspergillus pseudotamarii]